MRVIERLPHPDRLGTLSRENKPDSKSHGALDIFEIPRKVNGKSFHKPPASHDQWGLHIGMIPDHDLVVLYHRMTAEAQVNPAPNAPSITNEPSLIRPSRTASSRAIGMDAADVFP